MVQVTSAVDAFTEKEILDSLREVAEDKTTLVIAHRLASIMDADLIIVMHKGEVVEVRNVQLAHQATHCPSMPPTPDWHFTHSAASPADDWVPVFPVVSADGYTLEAGERLAERVREDVGHPAGGGRLVGGSRR